MAEAGQAHEAEGHEAHAAHGETAAHGEGAHEAHAEHGPLDHIQDYAVVGLGKDGKIYPHPYQHGAPVAGYEPATVGPFKLEFTRAMQDLTVVAVLLAAVVIVIANRIRLNTSEDKAPKGPLANVVEAFLIFVRDELVKPMGGKHAAPYTPLFVTYFFFILACNLSGMIPWFFHGATANIGVTGALGGSVFVILTILGMYKQGPLHYFMHMVPPGTPWPMWPLMFVLELMGPLIKCFVLCIRLFANMIAGHLVVGSVLGLGVFKPGVSTGMAVMGLCVGAPLALGVGFLEILVCLIQAYVFTMLAVIFVGSAVHPEH